MEIVHLAPVHGTFCSSQDRLPEFNCYIPRPGEAAGAFRFTGAQDACDCQYYE